MVAQFRRVFDAFCFVFFQPRYHRRFRLPHFAKASELWYYTLWSVCDSTSTYHHRVVLFYFRELRFFFVTSTYHRRTVVLFFPTRFNISFFNTASPFPRLLFAKATRLSYYRMAVRAPYSLAFLALLICYTRLVYLLFMLQRKRIVFYFLLWSQHVRFVILCSLCFSVEGVSS